MTDNGENQAADQVPTEDVSSVEDQASGEQPQQAAVDDPLDDDARPDADDEISNAVTNDIPGVTAWVDLLKDDGQTDRHGEAIEALAQSERPDIATLALLEQTAIYHLDGEIRLAAQQALSSSAFRALQQQQSQVPQGIRRFILKEIERWRQDRLMDEFVTAVLKQRYDFDLSVARKEAVTPKEEKPPRTLAEILLGETAIKTALYLGAFFVIAAACFFATAVEALRLPILVFFTLIFFGGAVGLKRRLPQASFIFAIVFSFLIITDGIVLEILYQPIEANRELFWTAVALVLSLLWLAGTWFYRSRIFSVLSLLGFCGAAFGLSRWLDQALPLDVFLISIPTLFGLAGVVVLRRWQDKAFSHPLFWTAQLLQIILLVASVALIAFDEVIHSTIVGFWWIAVGLTWLLAVIFYGASNVLLPLVLFRLLAIAALIPIPLLMLNSWPIDQRGWLIGGWIWAALLAVGSEVAYRLKQFRLSKYSLFMLGAAALIFTVVADLAAIESGWLGISYCLGTALIFLGLTYLRPRGWVFGVALGAITGAYFSIFALPMFDQSQGFAGFITVVPPLVLLSGYLVSRRLFQMTAPWYAPFLIVGLIFASLNITATVIDQADKYDAAIVFFIWAIFAIVFSWIEQRPGYGYVATVSLGLGLLFVALFADWDVWVLPFVGLASLYYFGGFGLNYLSGFVDWATMFRWSGLGLGLVVSLSAPLQGGATPIIGVAIVALIFTIEGFSKRNVWYGVPANVLYLMAYFMALLELEVTEPQYFSIGAALIGIIMHYFLIGSGSKLGAFITGLLTQLILLSTTYIQMVASERLIFFVGLFLQSLVLLVYGLVVRSRSFFLVPICFLVVGVISLSFTVLAGVPTIILIGCTGFGLLGLGILALVMRERLVELTDQLGNKLGGWRA